MPSVRKLRLANPHKGSRKKKRNWGGGELLVMSNPKKKRSRRKSYRRSKAARAANPFRPRRVKSYRRRSHRNPSIAGFSSNEVLKLALGAAGGSIGTRFITQAVLGDKNSGAMGYGASAATALALAYGAGKFFGKDVANGVIAGGLSAILIRIWQERVSGTSPAALSGYLGDLDFSSDG